MFVREGCRVVVSVSYVVAHVELALRVACLNSLLSAWMGWDVCGLVYACVCGS